MVGFGPPASRKARREWWRRQIQRQQEGSLTVAESCGRLGARGQAGEHLLAENDGDREAHRPK